MIPMKFPMFFSRLKKIYFQKKLFKKYIKIDEELEKKSFF